MFCSIYVHLSHFLVDQKGQKVQKVPQVLLKKLELLIGLSRLAEYEKDRGHH